VGKRSALQVAPLGKQSSATRRSPAPFHRTSLRSDTGSQLPVGCRSPGRLARTSRPGPRSGLRRRGRPPLPDAGLLAAIQRLIADLPYRRVHALLYDLSRLFAQGQGGYWLSASEVSARPYGRRRPGELARGFNRSHALTFPHCLTYAPNQAENARQADSHRVLWCDQ
jgi:hypothetical protein